MATKQPPEQTKTAEDVRLYFPVTDLRFEGKSSGFECYFIPAPSSLRPDSYDAVRRFLQELVAYFTVRLGCGHESFIQIGQVREEATVHLFADNARKWIPETGLGVWPHRPAPRMWKMEDMEEVDSDAGMPPLLHSVFRVTAGANERLDAMTTMIGTSCGLQLISRLESAALLRNLSDIFLGFIHDRVFRIFPWYVPLIEKAVLVEPMEPFVASVLRGISLYIRESPEDCGILIVSGEPLAEILAQLGCQQIEDGTQWRWKLGD